MLVGKGHRFWELLRGEIPRKGAHSKVRARKVHAVRSIKDRHFQPFHISGGA